VIFMDEQEFLGLFLKPFKKSLGKMLRRRKALEKEGFCFAKSKRQDDRYE